MHASTTYQPCKPASMHVSTQQGAAYLGSNQGGREDDAVERHVVLGHELVELHLLGILPPLLPLLRVVGCDGEVADGRIKPHVKHLPQPVSTRKPPTPDWTTATCPSACSRPTLSVNPSSGTGVPHFKSRVMARGSSPTVYQLRVISYRDQETRGNELDAATAGSARPAPGRCGSKGIRAAPAQTTARSGAGAC